MNANFYYSIIPNLEADEYAYIQSLTEGMDEEKIKSFLAIYSGRRQRPEIILLTTLLGFVLVSGIQRFITGQVGLGILYLLTGGLCLIGTIYDLVNYKKIAFEHNRNMAMESLQLVR